MYNKEMEKLGKQASAIRTLFEYGKAKKKELGDEFVYDFSIGNPSLPSPSIVNESLIKLINEKDATLLHGYTSASGDDNVKKAIEDYLNTTYNANVCYKDIYMTCGAAASLAISFNALLNKGEEVILFAPYFPEYKVFVEKANGVIDVVKSDQDFQIDFKDLNKHINKNTKIVVINSPNNPSGVVYSEETIIKLAKLLEEKSKEYQHPIYLVSDEP